MIYLNSSPAILALASMPGATFDTRLTSILFDTFTAVLLLVGVAAFIWGKQAQKPDAGLKFVQISQRDIGRKKGVGLANIVAILPIVWLLLVLAGLSLASSASTIGSSTGTSGHSNSKPNSGSTPAPTTSQLARDLIKSGILTIGDDFDTQPQDVDHNSLEKALMNDIAQNMQLSGAQFVLENPTSNLSKALQRKHIDVAIGLQTDFAPTQQVDFIPYLTVGESLLVRQDNHNPISVNSMTNLCTASLHIGVIDPSTAYNYLVNTCGKNGPLQYRPYQSPDDAVQQLKVQNIDAIFLDSTTTDYYVNHSNGILARGSQIFNKVQEEIAILKTDTALDQAINNAFTTLQNHQTYATLLSKWGLSDSDASSSNSDNNLPPSNNNQP